MCTALHPFHASFHLGIVETADPQTADVRVADEYFYKDWQMTET
jgi:hypothetical protein